MDNFYWSSFKFIDWSFKNRLFFLSLPIFCLVFVFCCSHRGLSHICQFSCQSCLCTIYNLYLEVTPSMILGMLTFLFIFPFVFPAQRNIYPFIFPAIIPIQSNCWYLYFFYFLLVLLNDKVSVLLLSLTCIYFSLAKSKEVYEQI